MNYEFDDSKSVLILFVCILTAFAAFLVASSIETKTTIEVERVDGVSRVMMHGRMSYTFLIPSAENAELVQKNIRGDEFRIFADVEPTEKMWALISTKTGVSYFGTWTRRSTVVEIHIHSEQDIEGGPWKRRSGKSNVESGQTQVIK